MADCPVSISLRSFKTTNKRGEGGRVRLFPLSTSDIRMQSRFIRQLSRENRETNFVRMEEKGGIFECLLVMPVSKPLNSPTLPPPLIRFEDKIYKELFKFLKRRTKQERENVGNFCRFSGKCWNKGIQEFWTSFKRCSRTLFPLSLKLWNIQMRSITRKCERLLSMLRKRHLFPRLILR